MKKDLQGYLQKHIKTFKQDKWSQDKNYLKFIKQEGGVVARLYNNEAFDLIEVDISNFIDKSPIVAEFYNRSENEKIILGLINSNFSDYDKRKMKNHIQQVDKLFELAILEDDEGQEFEKKQSFLQELVDATCIKEQAVESVDIAKARLKGIYEFLYFYILFMENVLKVNANDTNTQNWQFNDLLQEALEMPESNWEQKIKKHKILTRIYKVNNDSFAKSKLNKEILDELDKLYINTSKMFVNIPDNEIIENCKKQKEFYLLIEKIRQDFESNPKYQNLNNTYYNMYDPVYHTKKINEQAVENIKTTQEQNNEEFSIEPEPVIENEKTIDNNINKPNEKIIYNDIDEAEPQGNAQQTNFTEAEVKQLEELYELKEMMLEQIKNNPVTDVTINNLQSIIDDIDDKDPEANIGGEVIIKDEFIEVLNYAIAKQQQAVENQKSAIQENERKSSAEQQKEKKNSRLLITKKDEAIMYLKQDFNKYIKKVHTRLREDADFVKTIFAINHLCDKKYIGKNLRQNASFLLKLEVMLLASGKNYNSVSF